MMARITIRATVNDAPPGSAVPMIRSGPQPIRCRPPASARVHVEVPQRPDDHREGVGPFPARGDSRRRGRVVVEHAPQGVGQCVGIAGRDQQGVDAGHGPRCGSRAGRWPRRASRRPSPRAARRRTTRRGRRGAEHVGRPEPGRLLVVVDAAPAIRSAGHPPVIDRQRLGLGPSPATHSRTSAGHAGARRRAAPRGPCAARAGRRRGSWARAVARPVRPRLGRREPVDLDAVEQHRVLAADGAAGRSARASSDTAHAGVEAAGQPAQHRAEHPVRRRCGRRRGRCRRAAPAWTAAPSATGPAPAARGRGRRRTARPGARPGCAAAGADVGGQRGDRAVGRDGHGCGRAG